MDSCFEGLNIGCVGNSSVIIQQLSHMRGGGLFTPRRITETLLPTQSMLERRSRMASSELRRPKSANPNRRLRTATHKVTDPRVRPEQPAAEREESSEYHNLNESLSVWTNDSLLEEVDPGQQQRPSAASGKQQRTPSPTSSTYDSLMTFECIQKASALRVLAKTLDRQRDVLQQASSSSGGNGSSTATGDSADSRKTTPPPRKLRPLGREYSGPF